MTAKGVGEDTGWPGDPERSDDTGRALVKTREAPYGSGFGVD